MTSIDAQRRRLSVSSAGFTRGRSEERAGELIAFLRRTLRVSFARIIPRIITHVTGPGAWRSFLSKTLPGKVQPS